MKQSIVLAGGLAIGAALFAAGCAGPEMKGPLPPEPTGPPPVVETLPELPEPFLPAVGDEMSPDQGKDTAKGRRALRVEETLEEKFVILNFEDAEIRTVIETIGDLLNINYILAPGISGKVTIQSYRKFPVKDLFSVFQSVLELNNLAAVVEGEFYKIIPIADAKTEVIDVGKGKGIELTLESAFVNQIVPLQFVKAADAANVLRNFMPKGADITVYEPTNLLIITARPPALRRLMKILDAVDLEETQQEAVQTFVYYVEHGDAKKLADILKTLYGKGVPTPPAARTATAPTPATRTTADRRTRRTPAVAPRATASSSTVSSVGGTEEGEILITAYEEINAILIKTSPRSYLAMVDALKKIDVPRKQVLIEVMVAEITLGEEDKYGVEWMLRGYGGLSNFVTLGINSGRASAHVTGTGEDGLGNRVLGDGESATAPAGGFATIFEPGRLNAVLNAFASADRLNVVANPHILTTDNEEARIEVGQEVPTASGTTTTQPISGTGTTTGSTVTTGQVQYRTTGVILEVKPHISEKERVMLDVTQEISSVFSETTGGILSPTFNQRKAKTTAIVQSGHTLVIGGLIREDKNTGRAGLPLLSKIPVLGALFGTVTRTVDRTELLMLVTPHVVSSVEEADRITQEFQDRVRSVSQRVETIKKSGN